jgi:WD40 repeat protein/Tfp pilus assembly protein PilF
MTTIFNVILTIIGILTSVATIISAIFPLLSRRSQLQDREEIREARLRRRKVFRLSASLALITVATLLTTSILLDRSTSTNNGSTSRDIRFLSTQSSTQPALITWSPDGTQIATADSNSGRIQIWNVSTSQPVVTYQPPTTNVFSLAWSPGGAYIAINANSTLSILQIAGKTLRRIPQQDTFFLPQGSDVISWSPDGTQIALASKLDTNIRVWNIAAGHIDTGHSPLVYSRHKKAVFSLSWSPDGRSIASASQDNTIQIWNLKQGDAPDQTIHVDVLNKNQDQTIIPNVAWSPDGQKVAIENMQGVLSTWDLKGQKLFSTPIKQEVPEYPASSYIAWAPDSSVIAIDAYNTNLDEYQIALIDSSSGDISSSFSDNSFSIDGVWTQYSLAWSPNQEYIATTSINGVVIFPSYENDHVVSRLSQTQQNNQLDFWSSMQSLVIAETSIIGLFTLYNTLRKFRTYPTGTSKKQKLISFLKRCPFYVISIIIAVSLMFLMEKYILSDRLLLTQQQMNVVYPLILGISLIQIVIVPSLIEVYLQPAFLNWRNSYRAKPLIKKGLAYAKQKKYHEAVSLYDQAIALVPGYVLAYINRGYANLALKEYQWALDDFNQALFLEPEARRIDCRDGRGEAYLKLGKYSQALDDFNKFIDRLAESNLKADTYLRRAQTHLWLQNVSEARVDFLRSATHDTKRTYSAWLAVWTSLDKKRPEKGRGEQLAMRLKEIADRNPQSYTAHLCRGIAFAFHQNLKSALKEIEQTIAQTPQREDAYFWKGMLLAYYYQGHSHSDQVVKSLEQALQKGLPPVLLTPAYWLEKDLPVFFTTHIQPLLRQYQL